MTANRLLTITYKYEDPEIKVFQQFIDLSKVSYLQWTKRANSNKIWIVFSDEQTILVDEERCEEMDTIINQWTDWVQGL